VARLELCDPSTEIHLEKEHHAVRGVNTAFGIHNSLKTGGRVVCGDISSNEPNPGLLQMSDRAKIGVMERGSSIRATASIPKDKYITTLLFPSMVWKRIRSIGYSLLTIDMWNGTNR
jgi:hypothetical protein